MERQICRSASASCYSDDQNAETHVCRLDVNQLLLDVNSRDFAVCDEEAGVQNSSTYQVNGGATQTPKMHRNGYSNGGLNHTVQAVIGPRDVDEQLRLLAEGPLQFVSGCPPNSWMIDIHKLHDHFRAVEISQIVRDRLGVTALRIIRMLEEKGKLDEKSLQEIGLLSARDLRQNLARLKSAGFIELQEVPREPQRQPNRTIFLWFYDPRQVRTTMIEDYYKSLARLLQRIKIERRRISPTLEKVERSDIKGSEDRFLQAAEMDILRQGKSRERWICGMIDRLDSSLAVFQ